MSTKPDMVVTDRPLASKVEALVGFGIPAADIATVQQTDEPSLRRDYPNEIAGGEIKANARVAESLFRKATGEGRESVTAAIFWLKTRARWKETSTLDVSVSVMSHEDALEQLWLHDDEPTKTRSQETVASVLPPSATAGAQDALQLRMNGPDAS